MRIRSTKPEFWKSRHVAMLTREDRLLFLGLWSYVDDNGVGLDDAWQIQSDLFPVDDDPLEVREFVSRGLATLSRVAREPSGMPFIVRYEVDGKRYLAITGWKHQRIDRPSNPRYPQPTCGVLTSAKSFADGDSRDSLASPRDSLTPGTGEQGNRGTGAQGQQTHLALADANADVFEEFWSAYPRKADKARARKAWPKAAKKLAPDRLVKAARYWAGLWQQAGVPKDKIPHATTWLNNERWDDEPPATGRGHLRAVSGGHVPYQNPIDQSVYDEDL